ncbi:MAG: hypothetical protein R2778_05585 [Saprospiraceae bacterium]
MAAHHGQHRFVWTCAKPDRLSFPLFSAGDHKGYLFVVFQIMAFATFIIECAVENAIGVSWYLFYTLWFAGLKE